MGSTARQSGLRPWHLLLIGVAAVVLSAWLPGRRSLQSLRPFQPAPTSREAGRPLHIVCTFLPTYVFTLNVAEGIPDVQVELLVPADVGCPHDYSLKPDDLKRVARAEIVVSNGLGLDPFLEEVETTAPHARILTISGACDVLREEHDPHHHDADSESNHRAADHGSPPHDKVNPHVWVSPREASRQVMALAAGLAEADRARAGRYLQNATRYASRLDRLAARCGELAAKLASKNRNVVTFHDAFAYLARDLNLNVVATLTQDPEHAPSARQIADTIDVIRKTRAAAIFYEPAYSDRVAQTVSRETGVPLYPLNPFNSMSSRPTARSYEEVMDQNLDTLLKALGGSP